MCCTVEFVESTHSPKELFLEQAGRPHISGVRKNGYESLLLVPSP